MVTVGFALLPILIVVTFVAVPRLTSASVTGAAVGSFPACLFAAVLLTVVVTFCLSFFDPGGGGAIIILLNNLILQNFLTVRFTCSGFFKCSHYEA